MRVPSIYACAGALLLLCGYTAAIAVMSVDLGSEWMKVAVVSPGVPMEIALNPASKRKTAVAVSIKDGERMFGADALVQGVKSPRHCYKYLLDLLGKKFDHPLVARFQAQNPFYTLVADPVRGTVLFKHDEETMYSPEELLGMILFHAKGQAESFTEQKVKDVVITAPIYFNQAERQALVAAAEKSFILCSLKTLNNIGASPCSDSVTDKPSVTLLQLLYMFGAGILSASWVWTSNTSSPRRFLRGR